MVSCRAWVWYRWKFSWFQSPSLTDSHCRTLQHTASPMNSPLLCFFLSCGSEPPTESYTTQEITLHRCTPAWIAKSIIYKPSTPYISPFCDSENPTVSWGDLRDCPGPLYTCLNRHFVFCSVGTNPTARLLVSRLRPNCRVPTEIWLITIDFESPLRFDGVPASGEKSLHLVHWPTSTGARCRLFCLTSCALTYIHGLSGSYRQESLTSKEPRNVAPHALVPAHVGRQNTM